MTTLLCLRRAASTQQDMNGEAMKFEYVADQAMALAYRWADDAAILALMFC